MSNKNISQRIRMKSRFSPWSPLQRAQAQEPQASDFILSDPKTPNAAQETQA